jgi:hypothetical protein
MGNAVGGREDRSFHLGSLLQTYIHLTSGIKSGLSGIIFHIS